MTDEERQRAMDFIIAQQAKNSVMDALIDSPRRSQRLFIVVRTLLS